MKLAQERTYWKSIGIGLYCCLGLGVAQAQVGGQSVYQFLNLVTSPRQAALGGKVVTLYDNDVNQGHFNPACINENMHNQLSVNYASYFADINYGTASYALTLDRTNTTVFAGMQYINYGSFDGYDANAQRTGTFTGSEGALSLGSASRLEDWPVYVGATVKVVTSALETYSSWGIGADLGALYIDEDNDINYGLVVRNLGRQVRTYNGTQEKWPTEIIFGVSQELDNVPVRWSLTFENLQQWQVAFSNPNRAQNSIDGTSTPEKVSFLNNFLRHTLIGVEMFPKKAFNLRLGYNFRRAEELSIEEQRSFAGVCLGFGIRYNHIKINYAYSRYTLAASTSLFGLLIDLE